MDTTLKTKANQPAAFAAPVSLFVAAVVIAGAVVAVAGGATFDTDDLGFLAVLAGFVVAAEVFDTRLVHGSRASVSAALILAGAIVAGLPGAVVLSLVCAAVDFLAHRKAVHKALFNAGALVLAGGAFVGAMELMSAEKGDFPDLLLPALAAAYVHFAVNSALVCAAISLDTGKRPYGLWVDNFLPLVPFYAVFAALAATMAAAQHFEGTDATVAVLAAVVTMRVILNQAIGNHRAEKESKAAAAAPAAV